MKLTGTIPETPVSIDVKGGVAIVTIDSPPVNALSREVRQGLINALAAAGREKGIAGVILTGKGGIFIAGADIREFGKPLTLPTLPDVISAIEACEMPVIAAIGGAALGGGYEIALACDARVAGTSTTVGLPEGNFGIIPGAGGIERLLRLTDAVTALEIVASGRPVKAPDAKAMGLVDVLAADPLVEAIDLAARIPGLKTSLRNLVARPFDAGAFEEAARSALRRGRNRPFVADQIETVRRAATLPFEEAQRLSRETFLRLRDSEESAALRHLFFAEREATRIPDTEAVKPLPVRTVGIIGAGTMGTGIAAAFLAAGYPVSLTDLNSAALSTARERIAVFLTKVASPAPLTIAENLEGLSSCDLLLEAAFESMDVKLALMARMSDVARPGAILASNTSYLDLDRIAGAAEDPARVVGLHFFAPAHIMKLLEIVRGARTAPEVMNTATEVGRRLRKVAVISGVGEGFIGNRIYNAYRTRCEALLMSGALPHEIDGAIESLGFAMGPFAVSDMSGLDIAWANRKRRHESGADRSADVPVLEWLVSEGRLGQKTGKGWYSYEGGKRIPDAHVTSLVEQARMARQARPETLLPEDIQNRALAAIVNESLLVLQDRIAHRASDIDLVLVYGYGFPKHLGGPLYWAKSQPGAKLGPLLKSAAGTGRLGDLALLQAS